MFESVRPFEVPDIVLSELEIAPDRPRHGQNVEVTVVISARIPPEGDETMTAEGCPVRFLADGEEFAREEIDLVPPDFEARTQAMWTAQGGRHHLVASVGCPGMVEKDATNNTRTLLLNGSPGPGMEALADVVIDSFSIEPTDSTEVLARARLRNIGWADAEDLPVRIEWLPGSTSPALGIEDPEFPVQEGEIFCSPDFLRDPSILLPPARLWTSTSFSSPILGSSNW